MGDIIMKLLHSFLLAMLTTGWVTAAESPRPLAKGVYAVLREGLTREDARPDKAPHVILLYDRKYSESDRNEPPKYVALDTSSFVPLVLAGPPETRKDDRGWTLLNVRLAPEQVKTLENFTRAHLGGTVAIVIDGEIITVHKVRSVIEGGQVQITRCNDDACQVLRLKLAK
jgi:preprotein translocase subunit SecD